MFLPVKSGFGFQLRVAELVIKSRRLCLCLVSERPRIRIYEKKYLYETEIWGRVDVPSVDWLCQHRPARKSSSMWYFECLFS